jgi:isoquinoline 1-oxidoreductase beta subunit
MNKPSPELSRRFVLLAGASAAGGLAIGVPFAADAATSARRIFISDGGDQKPEMTAFLVIDPDNSVTIRLPHQEMGQGTSTGLAMLAAEELECDWKSVRIEYASANRNQRMGGKLYGTMQTVGSSGLRTSVAMMQQAGASARERLRVAAAQHWKVDPSECKIGSGKCLHAASDKALTYGEIAAAAALVKLDKEPAIKTPDQYKLVGKWTPRLDTAPKLDGSAQFGIDAQVPGMVYAAVVSCPEFGGTLASVDEAPVQGRRGVIGVVKMKDAVAVVADRYWRASQALNLLKPVWASGGNDKVDQAQLDQAYRDALDAPQLYKAKDTGDVSAALAAPDAQVVEALYEAPYLAHAPMEPLNCTVKLAPDRVDVWISTQAPMAVLKLASEQTGVAPENVYVHNNYVGGGFGRRSIHDEMVHAIACAKQVGKPVKLIWKREQDIRRDRYRPQAAVRFKAALTKDGTPTAISSKVAVGSLLRSQGAPIRDFEPMAVEVIATHAYRFPNNRVEVALKNTHVPVSFWRSVGASQNTFFFESFIDELAYKAGKDPYQFRRELLSDRPDYVAVLDELAKRSGWGKPLPKGSGRGISVVDTYGTVTGQVFEVTVSQAGKLKVDKVTCAVDCYHAANPNTIQQQIEGGVVFGLTAALVGEITMKDGAPVQGNFNDYPLLKMADTPPIESHLVLTPALGRTWGGIGEPSVAPVAPALANAIFAATGKRIRRLPLKHADLSWA